MANALLRRRVVSGGLAGAAVGALAGAIVLLPDRVGLDRHAPFAQLTAFRPQLLAATAVLAGAGGMAAGVRVLRARGRPGAPLLGPAAPRHVVGCAAGLIVVVVIAGIAPVTRLVPDAPPGPGRVLTVLSLNTFAGKADPDALAATVRAERPDLVVLIEAGARYRDELVERLGGSSYRSWVVGEGGSPTEDWATTLLAAEPAGDVRVREVDLGTRYRWLEASGPVWGSTRVLAVHVASPVRGWIEQWPDELARLGRWCDGAGPAIVVGDLNATPDHSSFRAGTAGCTDAASSVGQGLEGTWPASAPAAARAPIDHVLLAGGPRAAEVRRVEVPGSDHLASLTRIVMPDG